MLRLRKEPYRKKSSMHALWRKCSLLGEAAEQPQMGPRSAARRSQWRGWGRPGRPPGSAHLPWAAACPWHTPSLMSMPARCLHTGTMLTAQSPPEWASLPPAPRSNETCAQFAHASLPLVDGASFSSHVGKILVLHGLTVITLAKEVGCLRRAHFCCLRWGCPARTSCRCKCCAAIQAPPAMSRPKYPLSCRRCSWQMCRKHCWRTCPWHAAPARPMPLPLHTWGP